MPPKRTLKPRSRYLGCLGLAVEQARKKARLTQEQLASRSDIHPTHVGGLERGMRNPSCKTLRQIADGLEMTPGELLTEADGIFEAA